ncbi:MAG: Mbeg1-like protein [Streptococcus salivarius]
MTYSQGNSSPSLSYCLSGLKHLPNLSGYIAVSGHSKGGNLALYSAVQSSTVYVSK